jgi:hypothetical protein
LHESLLHLKFHSEGVHTEASLCPRRSPRAASSPPTRCFQRRQSHPKFLPTRCFLPTNGALPQQLPRCTRCGCRPRPPSTPAAAPQIPPHALPSPHQRCPSPTAANANALPQSLLLRPGASVEGTSPPSFRPIRARCSCLR